MESRIIEWLRSTLPARPCLRLGPGDDAAVLAWSGRSDCVVTVDLLTDSVDFRVGEIAAERIGRKALAVNLSDLAAMAAKPVAVVVALALPKSGGEALAHGIYAGMIPLAEEFGVAIAGGDTNAWNAPLAISVTAIGETTPRGPLTRAGARPGDAILTTGRFGGSILGRHFDFTPRVAEALLLHEKFEIRAGTDCSDGLAKDLWHICQESTCGAEIDLAAVPIAEAAHELSNTTGKSALSHSLHDGEDFELIMAASSADAERIIAEQPLGVPISRIGRFVERQGLWQIDESGHRETLQPDGFEHRFGG